MNLLLILIVSIMFLCICNNMIDGYTNYERKDIYNQFMDTHYKDIFPYGNRNAGGPMFYKKIFELCDTMTQDEFHLHHSFYCGVSGSIIQSPEQYDYIKVKGIDGNEYYGKYYRCCWPCLCDIMKYVYLDTHVAKLKDKNYEHYVLVIGDPCNKELPKEVSGYNCVNNITENGIRTNNGHLIIGVLHDVEIYDESRHNIEDVMNQCKERMDTNPEDLKGGMGDIFVKLSLNNVIKDFQQCYSDGTSEY